MEKLLTLMIILLKLHSECIFACRNVYTGQANAGYRCVTNFRDELHQAKYPQCVWRCLLMNGCHYINHNSATDECELGLSHCESLIPDVGFMVRSLGPHRHDCLKWGSIEEPDRVTVGGRGTCIARIRYNGSFLVGKFKKSRAQFRTSMEGHHDAIDGRVEELEFLTKNEACTLPWMSYTAGDTHPGGAVAGGHLADRSPIYVAKTTDVINTAIGYYDAKTRYGYFWMARKAHMFTSMKILVLI